MAAEASNEPLRIVGRYALHDAIASGGMATVHLGRLRGPVGFARTVAIKRLHPEMARDPEFVAMFLDEARLAARIRHPNVVQTLDVVASDGELFLVMEYVQGESLARLYRLVAEHSERIPPRIVASIVSGALQGLHAAHESRDEQGVNLGLVHRDVSPHNILVGADGLSRVLDFGVAKAAGRVHTTRGTKVKGKLAYMAPEQIQTGEVTRAADIYSTAVVLWESLTGRRLFHADNQTTVLARILAGNVPRPSQVVPGLPESLDDVVLKGLARSPKKRYETAIEMALDLERCAGVESHANVAIWLGEQAGELLSQRAERIALIERGSDISDVADLRSGLQEIRRTGDTDTTVDPTTTTQRSGVVNIATEAKQRRRKALYIGAGVGILTGIVAVLTAVSRRADPEPSVDAVGVQLRVDGKHTTASFAPPVDEPKTQGSAAAEASAAVSADAAAPAAPKAKSNYRWRPKKPPQTSKPSKKGSSPFDGLGGRL